MANVFVDDAYLSAIADAIRYKTDTTNQMLPSEMAERILSISQSNSNMKYIELEFIETTGTQYIDTGFNPNQNTRLDITYQTSDSDSAAIAGADRTWSVDAFCVYTSVAEYGSSTAAVTLYGSSKTTVSFNKNTITQNGTSVATFTSSTFQCPCSITLFGCNRNGEVREMTTGKIYSCQIYDNGTLIRNLIPCIDISSGDIGMWDLKEDKFYKNAGTGSFGGYIPSE